MHIRTLVILLLNFTMAFGNNETTVFRQLASYDSRSAASSLEQWYPTNETDEQLKATAEAYLDLLKGNQEMAGSKLESIYTTLKNESGVDKKLAIYVDRALGYSQFMDGNLDSAYVHYWPALLLIREQYGTKSPIYIDQLRLVIELFRAQGKLGVAQEMLSTLHDLSKKVYGKEDAKTIEVLALLGSIGTEMARFDVAEGYFNQCNQLTENASTDPELTAKSMNLVYQSDFYLTKGNFTVAEALNNEALKILEHIYPDFHPAKSQAYLLKAKIYIAMNNLNEAGETLSELIAFQRSYYGENHPVLAKSQLELADVLIQQGFASSSQDLLQNCQTILEPSVGTSHADYCRLLILKAQAIAEAEPQKAKGYFLESIATLEKNYGKSHFYLAKALSSYSAFLYQANNLKTAEKQERKALEIRTTLFDFYHPDYANSLFMLAKINLKAGNKKEASIYLKKSAENYLIQYNKYFAFLSEYEKGQFYELLLLLLLLCLFRNEQRRAADLDQSGI
ncbi:tetratricopeptide repeat protein [Reichenbachiella ulvae]|uniref:Tetratricopeptide repeat protein n=1 Tax=Reichenbachiella ulvae TaxID=2980104 RepID=A0ABT3CQ49_9BACT|nr:tetratricopeptide repeat protein [Reichenbachiella ulvae]MCV9385769.1 tetratricopeptide repeat protein [Reichenbachiella ulvae]